MPTDAQWNTADTFGAWNNNTNTFNSVLKLPSAGSLHRIDGLFRFQGTNGYYWSSTVSGANARYLFFNFTAAYTDNFYDRADGFTVRCLKD